MDSSSGSAAAATAGDVDVSPGTARPVGAFECRELAVELGTGRDRRRILDDLTFDVAEGEFLSILGTSGAGKTTLLRVLAGLLSATPESTITFGGQPVVGPPEHVVTVFQDYSSSLLPWRTVEKNVSLGLEGKVSTAERKERIAEALSLVGLEARAKDYPWQLSGGMQQRVQIARALALRPSVLLMDEPFGSLDAMTKESLQDELQRVHALSKATIIFITHDIEEAVYLSDRILIIKGSPGHIEHRIDVPLPRPRHQMDTKEDPVYLRLRHQVYEAFAGDRG